MFYERKKSKIELINDESSRRIEKKGRKIIRETLKKINNSNY